MIQGALCVVIGVGAVLFAPAEAQESTGAPVIVAPAPGGAAPLPAAPAAQPGTQPVDERPRLTDIVVEGTQRIEPETIESYMTVRRGDPFTPADMNASHKALFATGLFADLTIRREGNVLIVRVVENPIINRIAFEGNLRINDDVLAAEVQLRPRVVFTRTRAQQDITRILQVYRRSGRFGASVEPKVIELEQNRVDLVFEIEEGPLTEIDRIIFIGNKRFSDRTLRKEVVTQESRWYRFYSSATKYDPDQLAFDKDLLRRFYLKNGYADFRVVSAVAELTPDMDAFYITFTLEEGERYRFGEINLVSKIGNVDPEPLEKLISVDEGDWYEAEEVEDSVLELTRAVGDLGYAFVDVRPKPKRDRENRTIGITFEIQEGPRIFVERIDISGNVRTLDKVIRREFRLVEGDAFNNAKLARSRMRIFNLGFFTKVDMEKEPGSEETKAVVKLRVEERSTGELGLGIGYSTTDGALANIVLRERNLLGKGQDIRASISISQRRQQFDISFTEPYFLDRELSAGIDLFHTTIDNSNISSFTSTRTGVGLRLGYEISERWSQRLRYTIRQDEVTNVPDTASELVKEQEGETLTSLVGQDLTYDRRDNKVSPTYGFFVQLSTDYAGLGGDLNYVRVRLVNGYYLPITENIITSLRLTGGIIEGIDQDVRITDSFNLGGDNLRGFATSGVGPRDLLTGDALGGKKVAYGSLAVRFPIGLPQEFGISGSLFSDFGVLTDIDKTDADFVDPTDIVDKPSIRVSWGTGLAWNSPVGPLRLDFAWPLKQEKFDIIEVFRLRFGTRF